jgi:hypothetical protein
MQMSKIHLLRKPASLWRLMLISNILLCTALISLLVPVQVQTPVTNSLPAIDFSYAGYEGGGVDLPQVPAITYVRSTEKDDIHNFPLPSGLPSSLKVQMDSAYAVSK